MTRRLSVALPIVLVGACLWVGAAAAAPPPAATAVPPAVPSFAGVVTPAQHRATATRLRPVHPSRRVSVSIAIRHDGKGLLARISGARVKSAPLRAIVRRHGATDSDIRAIVRWARDAGLTARVGSLRTRVIVSGPAGRMSRALGVPLHHYRARDGRTYIAAPRGIPVPRAIAGPATGIAGLSHVPPPVRVTPAPEPSGSAPPAAPAATSCTDRPSIDFSQYDSRSPGTPMTPIGMAQAYGFDAIGSGPSYPPQTVAILAVDQNYDPTDVATFQTLCRFGAGRAPVGVRAINLPGAPTLIGIGGNEEANMDAQVVTSLAPAGTSVVVINVSSKSPAPFSDFLEQAAALPNLTVVSMSYGGSEIAEKMGTITSPEEFTQSDALGQALAASGVSVLSAAGDQGSMGPPATACTVQFPLYGLPGQAAVIWPASAPWVTGVGGTMWNSRTRPVTGEQVWNENGTVTHMSWPCVVAAGGGGQSSLFLRPAWQAGAGAAVRGLGRLVPDVSMLAGQPGYFTAQRGKANIFEGTSASTPLLAAAVLRINAERLAAGRKPVGFLNPLLYGPLAAGIQDITQGNNDIFGNGICCTAGPGFDMASGLGVPNINAWPALIP